MQQTLATTAGQEYLLTFWLKNPANQQNPLPNEFQLQWDGVTLYDAEWHYVVAGVGVFQEWTEIVVASSSSTILSFGARANDGFAVDDVSVNAIPEPISLIIWSLFGLGSMLGLRVWRRQDCSAGHSGPSALVG